MEVDRHVDVLLEQFDKPAHAFGRNQSRHVLDGDHVGPQRCHLLRLAEEVGIGEDRCGLLFAHQPCEKSRFGIFRVDRVADRAVGDAAVLFDIFDCRFHVVHVVQGVEDPHDAQPALDGVAAEPVDDLVRIGRIAEQVAPARQCGEFRDVADSLVDRLKPRPGILVQVAHHRIGHGAAPYLHRIEVRILVVGQTAVDLLLRHACRKRRLLSVAQRKISDL